MATMKQGWLEYCTTNNKQQATSNKQHHHNKARLEHWLKKSAFVTGTFTCSATS